MTENQVIRNLGDPENWPEDSEKHAILARCQEQEHRLEVRPGAWGCSTRYVCSACNYYFVKRWEYQRE